MTNKEYLRRIDERDYLTEREHREYLEQLEKDLEILEILKKHIECRNGIISDYIFLAFPQKSRERRKIEEWLDGN